MKKAFKKAEKGLFLSHIRQQCSHAMYAENHAVEANAEFCTSDCQNISAIDIKRSQ